MLTKLIRAKSTTRYLSTKTSASIRESLKDKNDLNIFFEKPSWSTRELLDTTDQTIDQNIIDGLLDLSGLSKNISPKERNKILSSLTSQVNLIAKLNKADIQSHPNGITRLVDDKSVEVFELESMLESIKEIKSELSKGEIENSWNPLSLASESQNRYFIVREGLEKKNK